MLLKKINSLLPDILKATIKLFVFFVVLTPLLAFANIADSFLFSGETILFDIKKLGLRAGKAKLIFQGPIKIADQKTVLVIFEAKALNFLDEEKIYLDPKTFYPFLVERNLNIFGKKEKITEKYNHQGGFIDIQKDNGKNEKIYKKGPIDNLYAFLYRFRQSGNFKKDDILEMRLPTKDVSMKIIGKTKIKAAKKEFESYYIESAPRQYQIWVDSSEQKIPLRIDGALGIIEASLVMREYSKQ